MPTLVIVSCGKRKIWSQEPTKGPTKARDAYIGGPFRVNKKYAEKFSDRWVVLSAKHGFLDPDNVVPGNYNVTFKDPSTNPISISQLKKQVKQKRLNTLDTVVVLCGHDYAEAVSNAFSGLKVTIKMPLNGLRLGEALAKVKNAIDQKRPFDC